MHCCDRFPEFKLVLFGWSCFLMAVGCAIPTQHRIILSDRSPSATPEATSAGPVTIGLNDIRRIDGEPYAVNETVIRVNSLTFHRQEENPKMEVSVASINPKNGSEGILRNLVGRVKGAVANMFIPPISIKLEGNQAMLDFAQAIVDQRPTYTFPSAN